MRGFADSWFDVLWMWRGCCWWVDEAAGRLVRFPLGNSCCFKEILGGGALCNASGEFLGGIEGKSVKNL